MNKHINFDNIRLMYGCPIVDWKEIDDLVVKNEEEEEDKQDNDTTKKKNVLIRKKENE